MNPFEIIQIAYNLDSLKRTWHRGKTVAFGNDEVAYTGSATKEEAIALGNALTSFGYFQGEGATVRIDRETTGTAVGFVVLNGVWNRPGKLEEMEDLAKELAPIVGGFPLQVHLLDTNCDVQKASIVDKAEKLVTGPDQILCYGAATQDEAAALGSKLKRGYYFRFRGGTVALNKQNGGTSISFLVKDGVWNDPNVQAAFDEVARNLARAVGGLPVQVYLLNSQWGVEKSSVVGKIDFADDFSVYYEGAATPADAQALALACQSIGFGAGADVFLTKRDGRTTLAFTVADGTWDNPGKVSNFANIVRAVAGATGGLPVEMQLLSKMHWIMKREVVDKPGKYGTGEEKVLCFGAATQDEASALDNALRDAGYGDGRGGTVLLNKGDNGTAISFVLSDGAWNKPGVLALFRDFAKGAAPAVGGLPLQVYLVNSQWAPQKWAMVGKTEKLVAGENKVLPSGAATQEEADAIGTLLKQGPYFEYRGGTVLLNKGPNGTAISFVVKDGVWNNPEALAGFEEVALELAPRVGGFPVQLYLVNSQWAVQKWSMLGKVNFGSGNSVYSRGAATLADAQALGRRLESIGQKTDVYLIKHDGCTTLSFFLADESLCENAEWMRSIEGLVRSIAPAAGGLPISLQLLNAEYEVKKRVWVT